MDYVLEASQVKDKIDYIKEHGISRGVHCGFRNLFDYYSVKLGAMTFIMGPPDSGKTFFLFEMLINLSMFHNWNHVIYSPEMGNAEDVFGYLVEMTMGKHLSSLDEFEYMTGLEFVNEHFFIIDPQDNPFTILELYDQSLEIEKRRVLKIHTLSGDPFNEFKHDFRDDSGRQDLYIERILGEVRRKTKALNKHTFIVTHPGRQQITEDKGTGKKYYSMPTPREYAGGEAWYRKGLAMMAYWRPPTGIEFDGKEYGENEVVIDIQKAKPRGVGKKGQINFFFDYAKQRFYYEGINGKIFASDIYKDPPF